MLPDTISAGDTVAGGAGADSIAGGSGDDTISAAAGGGAGAADPPATQPEPLALSSSEPIRTPVEPIPPAAAAQPAPGPDSTPIPVIDPAAAEATRREALLAEARRQIAIDQELERRLGALSEQYNRILSAPAPVVVADATPTPHAEPTPSTPDATPPAEPAPRPPEAHPRAPDTHERHHAVDAHGRGHDAHPPGGHGHGAVHGHDHGHHEPWHFPRNLSEAGYLAFAIGIGTWNVAKFLWQFVLHPIIHTAGYVISGDPKHPWKTFWDGFTGDLKKAFFGKSGGGGKSHGGGGHGGGGHGGGGHH